MTQIGRRIAEAASNLVGTKFKLHGRDTKTGLDCVGVVFLSLKVAGLKPVVPSAYALRNCSAYPFYKYFCSSGLEPVFDKTAAGDVLLTAAGPAQFHLLIATNANAFVHAHAGLRRVVTLNGDVPWPVRQQWRSAQQDTKDI